MSIKALIFDLDDTLWPIAPVIENAEARLHDWIAQHVPQVVARYSISDLRDKRLALAASDTRFSYDLWALRHTLLTQVFDEFGTHPRIADEAMRLFSDARNQVTLFPDVMPSLNVLRQTHKLGSISNGFADLEVIGLAQHFSVSLAAHQFGCAKPDPRIFLAALEHFELQAQEVMYIGDDLRLDVEAAQQVGMAAAWVNRRNINLIETSHLTVQPDLIIRDLSELLPYLV